MLTEICQSIIDYSSSNHVTNLLNFITTCKTIHGVGQEVLDLHRERIYERGVTTAIRILTDLHIWSQEVINEHYEPKQWITPEDHEPLEPLIDGLDTDLVKAMDEYSSIEIEPSDLVNSLKAMNPFDLKMLISKILRENNIDYPNSLMSNLILDDKIADHLEKCYNSIIPAIGGEKIKISFLWNEIKPYLKSLLDVIVP